MARGAGAEGAEERVREGPCITRRGRVRTSALCSCQPQERKLSLSSPLPQESKLRGGSGGGLPSTRRQQQEAPRVFVPAASLAAPPARLPTLKPRQAHSLSACLSPLDSDALACRKRDMVLDAFSPWNRIWVAPEPQHRRERAAGTQPRAESSASSAWQSKEGEAQQSRGTFEICC